MESKIPSTDVPSTTPTSNTRSPSKWDAARALLHSGQLHSLIEQDQNIRHKCLHHIVAARLKQNGGNTTQKIKRERKKTGKNRRDTKAVKEAPLFVDDFFSMIKSNNDKDNGGTTKTGASVSNDLVMLQTTDKKGTRKNYWKKKRPQGYTLEDLDNKDIGDTQSSNDKHPNHSLATRSMAPLFGSRSSLKQRSIIKQGFANVQSLWILHIQINNAEKLSNIDGIFGNCNPYVSVSINNEMLRTPSSPPSSVPPNSSIIPLTQVALTNVVHNNTKNPKWNYKKEVKLAIGGNTEYGSIFNIIQNMKLKFTVRDADQTRDKYLGHYEFNGQELIELLQLNQFNNSQYKNLNLKRVKLKNNSTIKHSNGYITVGAAIQEKHLIDSPDDCLNSSLLSGIATTKDKSNSPTSVRINRINRINRTTSNASNKGGDDDDDNEWNCDGEYLPTTDDLLLTAADKRTSFRRSHSTVLRSKKSFSFSTTNSSPKTMLSDKSLNSSLSSSPPPLSPSLSSSTTTSTTTTSTTTGDHDLSYISSSTVETKTTTETKNDPSSVFVTSKMSPTIAHRGKELSKQKSLNDSTVFNNANGVAPLLTKNVSKSKKKNIVPPSKTPSILWHKLLPSNILAKKESDIKKVMHVTERLKDIKYASYRIQSRTIIVIMIWLWLYYSLVWCESNVFVYFQTYIYIGCTISIMIGILYLKNNVTASVHSIQTKQLSDISNRYRRITNKSKQNFTVIPALYSFFLGFFSWFFSLTFFSYLFL